MERNVLRMYIFWIWVSSAEVIFSLESYTQFRFLAASRDFEMDRSQDRSQHHLHFSSTFSYVNLYRFLPLDRRWPRRREFLKRNSAVQSRFVFLLLPHSSKINLPLPTTVTLQWEPKKAYGIPPSARGYHMTVLHDSRLFVIGGFNGQNVFDEVFTLDLGGNAFLPQITNFVIDELDGEEGR